MKVMNKNIIVTGAANGIGKEVVIELLKRGSKVFACDKNREALFALKDTLKSEKLKTYELDITNNERVKEIASIIIEETELKIDGIINCAGIIQPFERFEETPYTRIKLIMDVNFWGTINMIQAYISILLKRPESYIVNISSMGGFFPVPGQTIYGASKAAVRMLTEGLYAEYQNTNLKVTVVIPGGVNTKIIENSGSKPNEKMENIKKIIKLPSPQKAAIKIVEGMEKDRFRVFIGIDSKLLNLANKIIPIAAIRIVTKVTSSILFGH